MTYYTNKIIEIENVKASPIRIRLRNDTVGYNTSRRKEVNSTIMISIYIMMALTQPMNARIES